MIDVIQIYHTSKYFSKDDFNHIERKNFFEWNESFGSDIGYTKENILYLPKECEKFKNIDKSGLIALVDVSELKSVEYSSFFFAKNISFRIRNFVNPKFKYMVGNATLEKNEKGTYDFIAGGVDENQVIQDFKYSELTIETPLRQMYNFRTVNRGKSGYEEVDTIYELKQPVEKIEFLPKKKIMSMKKIPFEKCKVQDRRMLYKS